MICRLLPGRTYKHCRCACQAARWAYTRSCTFCARLLLVCAAPASQRPVQHPACLRGKRKLACRPAPRGRTTARAAAADEYVEDDSFSLAKVSFGDILTPVGIVLMTFGFGSYFQLIPGSGFSGVALIYGFPVLLLGFALKYAQLEPVGCRTSKQALELRETQMTDNLKQVREDCTRFRCAPVCGLVLLTRRACKRL